MRGRRAARYVAIGLGVAVVLLLGVVLVVTRTDWGRNQVRQNALDRIADAIDGEVTIGRVEGNLLREMRLIDVVIRDNEGRRFVDADTFAARFGLRALFGQRLELTDIRIVNATIVLDQPPGEEWNYVRIFRLDDPDVIEPGSPGWGDWVTLSDVEVIDSHVTVKTAWKPPPDLSPAEQDEALREALEGSSRERVVAVPGGHQNVMEMHELNAALPRVVMAHPDTAGLPFEVERLSGFVRPFSAPPARVHDLAGSFRVVRDSLLMNDVTAALDHTRLTGGGAYALHSGELLLHARADPMAFDDLRWLYPPLPEEGGGTLTMTVRLGAAATRIIVRDLDATIGDAAIAGRFDISTGDTVRFGETDLQFERLPTSLVERFVEFRAPRHGLLTGQLALRGVPQSLRLDGDVRFDDTAGGVSRVIADGEVGADPDLRFRDLNLRFAPLQAELARAVAPDLPLRGTVEGTAVLTGSPASLSLDADLVLRDPRHGVSRIAAAGGLDTEGQVRLRDMVVRMNPLRVSLLREWSPDLPLGGVLSGTATLNGSPATRLAVRGDVVHEDSGARSRIIGSAAVPLGGGGLASVDVRLQPFALSVVGAFAPAAGLRGTVAGRLQADGRMSDLRVDADLQAGDGGTIHATGTLDLAAAAPAYDLDMRMTGFDFASVTQRAPASTNLTGFILARGQGFEPATMRSTISADLAGSSVDDVAADRVLLSVDIADGLARVDSSVLRVEGADAEFDGSFGLTKGRRGELAYSVTIDSLHALASRLPGADTAVARPLIGRSLADARTQEARPVDPASEAQPDTSEAGVEPPEAAASRRYTAADGSTVTISTTRVQRAIERDRTEPGRLAVQVPAGAEQTVDTVAAQAPPVVDIPADSVSGRLHATGSVRGNITDFDITGSAVADDLVYRGVFVGHGTAEYTIEDVRTPSPDIAIVADMSDAHVAGMAFDTASVRGHYHGVRGEGSGDVAILAQTFDDNEYRADVEFTLSLPRSELRVAELSLRLDTITWSNTRPGAVSWDGDAIEVASMDLVSDAGGRIMLDGRLPADGTGDLDLLVEDLEVAQLAELLQLETAAAGRLNLEARVSGTTASPRIAGEARLDRATLGEDSVPDLRATFEYDEQLLVADAQLLQGERQIAVADARLPVDLSFSPTGPRLLDGELTVNIQADSLPVEAIPVLAAQVDDVSGNVRGDLAVRGTFADPELTGDVDLDLASIRVVPANVRLDSIRGRLHMSDNLIIVDSIVARSGGSITVTGEIALATLTNPEFALEIDAREALVVNTEDVTLHVDADIDVGGTLERIEVGGELRTRKGVIWIPTLDQLGSINVVALHTPATFERFETAFVEERRALERQRPLLERLRLDVDVIIDRDVWLRSTEANVEIYTPAQAGPLHIRTNDADPSFALEGAINADRGEYEFMSRRFSLTRGAATFTGEPDINPILQIAAQHEVRLPGREAFDIRVLIGGTMREVEITLESTSQPPIAQTDLLSYLALGRDATGLLQRQGSALSGQGGEAGELVGNVAGLATNQLGTIALDVLVTDLETELIREFGLDVFRITPADLPPDMFTGSYLDVLRSTEIEGGRYVSPRLFVAGQLASSLSRPGVRVEYATPLGVQWLTSWTARWLPSEPTLTPQDPRRASVLGSFLSRQWRF